MNRFILFCGIIALSGSALTLCSAGQGDEVVVIYNGRLPESKGVAEHYAALRHVPAAQVLSFDLPTAETMSRADFRDRLQKPLAKALERRNLLRFGSQTIPVGNGKTRRYDRVVVQATIRYAVLCYGVPLRIAEDPFLKEADAEKLAPELRRNGAAVDSELACLPLLEQKVLLAGPKINPLFGCTNAHLLNPTNGILLVTRLDGPTAAIARGLVDKAIQAETDGLWGRAYFDLRGLPDGQYKLGDDWIRGASEISRRLGFETMIDTNGATFPASFPLSQVAFYAGWYDENVSGPFARPTVEFMPGAFAYHLHSFSAATLRSTTRQWVGPLLSKGVTATMGCVDEPFLAGTPDMTQFFSSFLRFGFSFGEAAYAAQHYLSWQVTAVGDPLYRPFARNLREQHEDLERRHSNLVDWSYLRAVDFKLANREPVAEAIDILENLELTKSSAVLEEKLADLYFMQGKPSSSAYALQQALKLDPSPQQRVRILLTLGERLLSLDRDSEAYGVYQRFLTDCPDYPDRLSIYQQLLGLAQKLGKKEDAAKYQAEVNRLTGVNRLRPIWPALRHGT